MLSINKNVLKKFKRLLTGITLSVVLPVTWSGSLVSESTHSKLLPALFGMLIWQSSPFTINNVQKYFYQEGSGQEGSGQEESGQEESGQEESGQEESGQEESGQEESGQEESRKINTRSTDITSAPKAHWFIATLPDACTSPGCIVEASLPFPGTAHCSEERCDLLAQSNNIYLLSDIQSGSFVQFDAADNRSSVIILFISQNQIPSGVCDPRFVPAQNISLRISGKPPEPDFPLIPVTPIYHSSDDAVEIPLLVDEKKRRLAFLDTLKGHGKPSRLVLNLSRCHLKDKRTLISLDDLLTRFAITTTLPKLETLARGFFFSYRRTFNKNGESVIEVKTASGWKKATKEQAARVMGLIAEKELERHDDVYTTEGYSIIHTSSDTQHRPPGITRRDDDRKNKKPELKHQGKAKQAPPKKKTKPSHLPPTSFSTTSVSQPIVERKKSDPGTLEPIAPHQTSQQPKDLPAPPFERSLPDQLYTAIKNYHLAMPEQRSKLQKEFVTLMTPFVSGIGYVITGFIKAGTEGTVFSIKQNSDAPDLPEEVLKITPVLADELSRYSQLKIDIDNIQRLEPEASSALIPILHHRLYISSPNQHGLYIQRMPKGSPLRDMPMTNRIIWEQFLSLLERIQILHSKHFVHLDIKPSNMVLYRGKWVLVDLGMNFTTDKNRLFSNMRHNPGTAFYLGPACFALLKSPENNTVPSFRYQSDADALTISVLHLLLGNVPGELLVNKLIAESSDHDYVRLLDKIDPECGQRKHLASQLLLWKYVRKSSDLLLQGLISEADKTRQRVLSEADRLVMQSMLLSSVNPKPSIILANTLNPYIKIVGEHVLGMSSTHQSLRSRVRRSSLSQPRLPTTSAPSFLDRARIHSDPSRDIHVQTRSSRRTTGFPKPEPPIMHSEVVTLPPIPPGRSIMAPLPEAGNSAVRHRTVPSQNSVIPETIKESRNEQPGPGHKSPPDSGSFKVKKTDL